MEVEFHQDEAPLGQQYDDVNDSCLIELSLALSIMSVM